MQGSVCSQARPARWLTSGVAGLLLVAAAVSLVLTVYALNTVWPALPSGDILGADYIDDMLLAREGVLRLDGLWVLHNGVHCVALPKLVFWLDTWMTGGQGHLTLWCAAFLQLLVALLWVRCIARFPLTRSERVMLSALALLMLTSMVQAETLLDPINIQWAFLALGTTLTGMGLQQEWRYRRGVILVGVIMSGLSGGPLLIIALALLMTIGFSTPGLHAHAQRALKGLLILAGLICVQELIRLQFFERQQSLLLYLYRTLLSWEFPPEMMAALPENPWVLYGRWGLANTFFVSQFLSPPLDKVLPAIVAVVPTALLLAYMARVLWRLPSHRPMRSMLLYVAVFVVLLGVAAGLIRSYSPFAYTGRFANMGLLFVLAMTCLGYLHGSARWRVVVMALTVPYALLMVWAAYQQAGRVVITNSQTVLSQIAYAVGSDDTTAIVQSPGFYWQDENARVIREHRSAMKAAPIGVFASPDYRTYSGERALPARQATCLVDVQWGEVHATDPLAWRISGTAVDDRGQPLRHVLLQTETGEPIGFGVASQHVGKVFMQWQMQAYWSGHWKSAAPVQRVRIIAWNDRQQCAPVWWEVPATQ